jgi:hypothetical protein
MQGLDFMFAWRTARLWPERRPRREGEPRVCRGRGRGRDSGAATAACRATRSASARVIAELNEKAARAG